VLYAFTGGVDGSNPDTGLIRDAAGNLYGTTPLGGNTSSSCPDGPSGCGVVFKLDPSGQHYRVLYTFTGGTDGGSPAGSLIRDAAGNLYGTAGGGNTSSSCPEGSFGCGVVFKVDPSGNETVLYTFTGGTDGLGPGNLIRDAAGNLYGTADGGGDFSCSQGHGCGVVFKLDPAGNETVLHTFTGGAAGSEPVGLIRDAAGDFYGLTLFGGDTASSLCRGGVGGCGVLFNLDGQGQHYRVLHTFTGGADGANPTASLLFYSGSLYGTALQGSYDFGVVFKLQLH
jgi:uncharacterized repeat protein (TIGR03803 family)